MSLAAELPVLVQGGMGVGVSSWRLARAVSLAGGLGVVSGTALDLVVARRLQDGDLDGSVRRALERFPDPAVARRVLDRYFRPGGRPPGRPYRPVPKLTLRPTPETQELTVVGNFVEVWLAKEGHDGPIGVNYLEKLQMATPAAVLGALLAGVDAVLMGAGVPREIPRLLDDLCAGRPGGVTVDVHGDPEGQRVEVDPQALLSATPALTRPAFLAIVSATVLAAYLARDPATCPDGFVVEGPEAGGHNAPPRQRAADPAAEPVYGPRDEVDLGKLAGLGLPFWLAGGYGTPDGLKRALAAGARGIQVGSLFALCDDSGFEPRLRDQVRTALAAGTLRVRTDPLASPTGFPFKVAQVPGTLSDGEVYDARARVCDLAYLRTPYRTANGGTGYRCPGEPVRVYQRKGGAVEDTEGRMCLCNALVAGVGAAQIRPGGGTEPALVTFGRDVDGLREFAAQHADGWSALDALRWLRADPTTAPDLLAGHPDRGARRRGVVGTG